jgi:hypothetical protein
MPQSFKVLGQINPTANTQTNVYVVPASTEAVISTITVTNYSTSNGFYSLAVMPPGTFASPAANSRYIILGGIIPGVETIVLTMGLTGNANTVFAANASHANIVFNMFGSEIT